MKGDKRMKKKNVRTQKTDVLHYMQTRTRGITSMQAFEKFGVTRLSDIIFKLRKEGYEIETEQVTTKNRYGHTTTFARYRLV